MADIEALRGQFSQTQDLYREVCGLMFFRYGVTPTANKLYQLVRKGSMSAPAEALNRFWENLRDKSRVVIAHPDLPEPLKAATAELAVALWKTALDQAGASLAGFRQDAQLALDTARGEAAAALAQRERAQSLARDIEQQLSLARQRIAGLESDLATASNIKVGLEATVLEAKDALVGLHQHVDRVRDEHGQELATLREATALAEARCRAVEERSLLEIDRERSDAKKWQKMVELERANTAAVAQRHQTEVRDLHNDLGTLRQRFGVMEGTWQASVASLAQCEQHLSAARQRLDASKAEIETLRVEIGQVRQAWQQAHADANLQREMLAQAVQAAPTPATPATPGRVRKPRQAK
ncbi:MAG: DNA-binding protein [Pseudomonadota bacterium]